MLYRIRVGRFVSDPITHVPTIIEQVDQCRVIFPRAEVQRMSRVGSFLPIDREHESWLRRMVRISASPDALKDALRAAGWHG